MADKKATTTEAKPRKTPVRKAPKQSDYPTRLAWLAAMVEYEKAEAEKTTAAKVARLDKRIATRKREIERLTKELEALQAERAELAPEETLAQQRADAEDQLGDAEARVENLTR